MANIELSFTERETLEAQKRQAEQAYENARQELERERTLVQEQQSAALTEAERDFRAAAEAELREQDLLYAVQQELAAAGNTASIDPERLKEAVALAGQERLKGLSERDSEQWNQENARQQLYSKSAAIQERGERVLSAYENLMNNLEKELQSIPEFPTEEKIKAYESENLVPEVEKGKALSPKELDSIKLHWDEINTVENYTFDAFIEDLRAATINEAQLSHEERIVAENAAQHFPASWDSIGHYFTLSGSNVPEMTQDKEERERAERAAEEKQREEEKKAKEESAGETEAKKASESAENKPETAPEKLAAEAAAKAAAEAARQGYTAPQNDPVFDAVRENTLEAAQRKYLTEQLRKKLSDAQDPEFSNAVKTLKRYDTLSGERRYRDDAFRMDQTFAYVRGLTEDQKKEFSKFGNLDALEKKYQRVRTLENSRELVGFLTKGPNKAAELTTKRLLKERENSKDGAAGNYHKIIAQLQQYLDANQIVFHAAKYLEDVANLEEISKSYDEEKKTLGGLLPESMPKDKTPKEIYASLRAELKQFDEAHGVPDYSASTKVAAALERLNQTIQKVGENLQSFTPSQYQALRTGCLSICDAMKQEHRKLLEEGSAERNLLKQHLNETMKTYFKDQETLREFYSTARQRFSSLENSKTAEEETLEKELPAAAAKVAGTLQELKQGFSYSEVRKQYFNQEKTKHPEQETRLNEVQASITAHNRRIEAEAAKRREALKLKPDMYVEDRLKDFVKDTVGRTENQLDYGSVYNRSLQLGRWGINLANEQVQKYVAGLLLGDIKGSSLDAGREYLEKNAMDVASVLSAVSTMRKENMDSQELMRAFEQSERSSLNLNKAKENLSQLGDRQRELLQKLRERVARSASIEKDMTALAQEARVIDAQYVLDKKLDEQSAARQANMSNTGEAQKASADEIYIRESKALTERRNELRERAADGEAMAAKVTELGEFFKDGMTKNGKLTAELLLKTVEKTVNFANKTLKGVEGEVGSNEPFSIDTLLQEVKGKLENSTPDQPLKVDAFLEVAELFSKRMDEMADQMNRMYENSQIKRAERNELERFGRELRDTVSKSLAENRDKLQSGIKPYTIVQKNFNDLKNKTLQEVSDNMKRYTERKELLGKTLIEEGSALRKAEWEDSLEEKVTEALAKKQEELASEAENRLTEKKSSLQKAKDTLERVEEKYLYDRAHAILSGEKKEKAGGSRVIDRWSLQYKNGLSLLSSMTGIELGAQGEKESSGKIIEAFSRLHINGVRAEEFFKMDASMKEEDRAEAIRGYMEELRAAFNANMDEKTLQEAVQKAEKEGKQPLAGQFISVENENHRLEAVTLETKGAPKLPDQPLLKEEHRFRKWLNSDIQKENQRRMEEYEASKREYDEWNRLNEYNKRSGEFAKNANVLRTEAAEKTVAAYLERYPEERAAMPETAREQTEEKRRPIRMAQMLEQERQESQKSAVKQAEQSAVQKSSLKPSEQGTEKEEKKPEKRQAAMTR